MGILIDKSSRVIVQGITGREGQFHTQQMLAYGTRVVGGVTPGKGGQKTQDVPIFDTIQAAGPAVEPNVSCIFVPPPYAADAIFEAIDAEIPLIVCITEGIPTSDMIRVYERLRHSRSRLIGPNCPGLITVDECKVGIMPGHIFKQGPVGLVSRSGTLTYEIVNELSERNLGQSTCVGIGGDPIIGTTFLEVLQLFEKDPQTQAVVLVGEIGGADEETAAPFIAEMKKPVIGFISGRTAPPGKRMGHAGAIVSGTSGTAQAKVEALQKVGVPVANTTVEIVDLVAQRLGKVMSQQASR